MKRLTLFIISFMVLLIGAVAGEFETGMFLAAVMPAVTPDALKEELDKIAEGIDKKLEDIALKAKEAGADEAKKAADAVKEEVQDLLVKYNTIKEEMTKRIDEIEIANKRLTVKDGKTNWGEFMMKTFKEDEGLKKFIEKRADRAVIDIKQDDMTQGNAFNSTNVVNDMRVPGIYYDPDRKEHIRDILTSGVTSSNAVGYVKEHAYADNTDVTTEGAEYKQGDFDLTLETANVRKITNYIILSEEMLEDVEGLTSYILARLPSKIKLKEDQQILFGAGTGVQLSGITVNAAAYSDVLADSTVTEIDIVSAACNQARIAEYKATYTVLHPTDVNKIRLLKDSTGRYIMPWIFSNQTPTINGVPILETTAMTVRKFLVGDFMLGAQIFDRRQVQIEFSNESEDNFIKGMVTVRGSERLALAMYLDNAFVYGDFDVALAQGTA